jgi:hypothetical protein
MVGGKSINEKRLSAGPEALAQCGAGDGGGPRWGPREHEREGVGGDSSLKEV